MEERRLTTDSRAVQDLNDIAQEKGRAHQDAEESERARLEHRLASLPPLPWRLLEASNQGVDDQQNRKEIQLKWLVRGDQRERNGQEIPRALAAKLLVGEQQQGDAESIV